MSDGVRDLQLRDARRRDVEIRLLAAIVSRSPLTHPEPGSFTAGVTARLDQRGDTIRRRPIDHYLREISEEALDLSGWAVLAAQHPHGSALLPSLVEAAAFGAAAHAVVLRREIRR